MLSLLERIDEKLRTEGLTAITASLYAVIYLAIVYFLDPSKNETGEIAVEIFLQLSDLGCLGRFRAADHDCSDLPIVLDSATWCP